MTSRKRKTNLLPAVFCSVFGHALLAVLLFFSSAGSFNVTVNMNDKPEPIWMSLDFGDKAATYPDEQVVPQAPQEAERVADAVMPEKQSKEVVREKAATVQAADKAKSSAAANQEGAAATWAGEGEGKLAAAAAALPIVRAAGFAAGFAEPSYREKTLPVYPRLARLRGYEGVVLVATEILPDGNVGNLKIKKSSGHTILDEAAMTAVKKWKFEPARKMGKPCAAWRDHVIRFSLDEDNSRT